MDLRIVKTRTAILSAWETLRAKKPVEKISVKELSELAQINKATFYLHFHDIYDLSDYWERRMIEQVLVTLPPPEVFLADPAAAVITLAQAFLQKSSLLEMLYPHNTGDGLAEKLEEGILHYLSDSRPDWADNEQAMITLRFCIYGGFYAFVRNGGRDPRQVTQALCKIAIRLVPLLQ